MHKADQSVHCDGVFYLKQQSRSVLTGLPDTGGEMVEFNIQQLLYNFFILTWI
jgi:hypothetical protein